VIGPKATRSTLAALRERVQGDPRGWIAQPVVMLSTVPTLIDGELQPRHVDLRAFAVNDGHNVWVPAPCRRLTRVALPAGQLVVNSSQGGGSKDTWVQSAPLDAAEGARRTALAESARVVAMSGPDLAPDDGATAHNSNNNSNRPARRAPTVPAVRRAGWGAEPDRRVAVLDRPVHRAGRRHGAHPRHPSAVAAGRSLDRRSNPPAGHCCR